VFTPTLFIYNYYVTNLQGELMLIEEIKKSIEEIQQQKTASNDGVSVSKTIAEKVIESAQAAFKKYGATQSVDERIKILAESVQDCVKIVEDFHNELEKKVEDFTLQIKTLDDLLKRVEKFEAQAGVQNVSIEDDGEKK
jgi:DNA repair ATPase RecN